MGSLHRGQKLALEMLAQGLVMFSSILPRVPVELVVAFCWTQPSVISFRQAGDSELHHLVVGQRNASWRWRCAAPCLLLRPCVLKSLF
mmetsp:Transcript_119213/g.337226  ORF Transcript_119213/g.337226 Transcript_119213/m.337226 type:complete len:88 (+) Transcript_119213:483-746(+)